MIVLKRNLLLALMLILPSAVNAENYSIGTGGQSGIYYPFGGALAKVWSEHVPDVNAKAEVTAASVENTIKVVRGDMIAGIAMGNVVLDAYKGEGKFPTKMPVNTLFALYPNLVHTLTLEKSGITSLSQLKGKRVSLGAPASGTAVTSAALLESLGIDVKKDIDAVYLNYSETTNALANGQIDAGFIVGGQGVGAVTQIALTHKIKVLSITPEESAMFMKQYPAYSSYDIPADVYNNVGEVSTLSVWNVLVVNAKMSDDMAYNLTKAAYENMGDIRKVVKMAEMTTPKNADRLQGVPLHPGAQKYLDSIMK
ncbi:TAXI family TRAP transporter solute-binding subunit [Aliivibrio finisterrensis]|uniref:TAXI family TRAP transporter solute-binding subunit n=1 Tax=Aliivibrio finisterrensis TaxID=511998 RepID=A0A4Q5KKY0_9GAMM|nr:MULTISPECIES: TAXI family TRAP transporter solute-binding subunit [Aliivibrio]MDD9173610.1 TAXI family TRAP transporter solute-binding subunit [Aliivibrio sp. S3TY1]MDD9190686.1 TAXI family TRAP transporter solute-binding subunit [Aliivibrio sp. S2TY2]RYU46920.1 TAXI family TRAP transporter solute-binding subunit [Aliivibrio finisterrensis]